MRKLQDMEIQEVLERGLLKPVFQLIARFEDAAVFAYQALTRGPEGTRLADARALFASARQAGLTVELELACYEASVRAFAEHGLPGRLFVNLGECALLRGHRENKRIEGAMLEGGLSPNRLVVELTQRGSSANSAELQAALRDLRGTGVALALDDFGEGQANHRLWAELRPEMVKIGRYFVGGIDQDPEKFRIVKSLVQLAEVLSSRLVAEGIEVEGELAVLRDLGVAYGQGRLLGEPSPNPAGEIPTEALQVLRSAMIAVYPEAMRRPQRQDTVGQLITSAPSITSSQTNDELTSLLREHAHLHAVAVVQAGAPVGLINRRAFVDRFSRPYHRELFGRRACTLFMNPSPLIVDKTTSIEALVRTLTRSDHRYLSEGFVICDQGQYLGLGTGEALVAAVTEVRVEAARHANPPTFLPGNIPLTEHIERLLSAGHPFVAYYFDLNHFKAFNDQYGYWRGDEVIKLVAQALVAHCDPLRDFVGHVGAMTSSCCSKARIGNGAAESFSRSSIARCRRSSTQRIWRAAA